MRTGGWQGAPVTTTETMDLYCAVWNARDADERRALVRQVWSDDGRYVDPTADVSGGEALVAHVGGVLEAFGDFRLRRTSGVDEHHDHARFTWSMETAEGGPIADGFDVVTLAADGRIDLVVGFFGPFPTP